MATPVVVCVLGMHRSGTSVIARLVNLLGVYLGPEEHLLDPASDNPKGFWEHRPILEMNRLVLAKLGGSALEIPAFPDGWELSQDFAELRDRARSIVEQDFAAAPLWGWKDPRTCLTLPFWQQVNPEMRYVLCLRNPLDSARSLAQRNGLSLGEGIRLWLAHVGLALQHTAGQPRILVFYDDVLDDPAREMQRLAQLIGGVDLEHLEDARRQAATFLERGLQHHRTPVLSGADEPSANPADHAAILAQQAYLMLRDDGLARAADAEHLIQDALALVAPAVEAAKRDWAEAWHARTAMALQEIAGMVPEGERFILADSQAWGVGEEVAGRRCIPFLERDGAYFGPPADDATAMRELDRLRRAGARFLVFGWPAFWWLDHYSGFHQHLRASYRCLLENDNVIVFDLWNKSEDASQ